MADKRHEHRIISERVRPRAIRLLADRVDPLEIADEISSDHRVDKRTAYRWVLSFEEAFRRRRRRFAITGLVLLWLAFFAVVGFVVELLLDVGIPALRLSIPVVAAISLTAGVFLVGRARRLAARAEIKDGSK